jgi:hypothetical protein
MKQVLAEDERGRSWIVYEGDSAWAPCQRLLKAGVKEVVLPSVTFLSGSVPPQVASNLNGLTADMLRANPVAKPLVRRAIRLQDCVAWLNQQGEAEAA